ncbi:MAG: acyltransferase [Ruminococcaceae bacterium]|nr:acyltransferase [Oscillospiraceae bacterium]
MAKQRVLYYDLLNICATLGVVLLHSNGLAHHYSATAAWYQAFAVEVLFFWPVPIFFMLSGATLMGYRQRYTTADFLKRRFMRTVIPFVVWSVICSFVYQVDPFALGLKEYVNRFMGTSILSIYWFFIPLFAVYLAMPVLSLLKENRRILWYMVGAAFVLTSLLPPVLQYVGIRWNGQLQFVMAGGYLPFAIMGYLFSTQEFTRRQRIIIYLLGVLGAAIRYGCTVWLSMEKGSLDRTFFSYHGYYTVFLAAAVFVWFRYSRWIQRMGEHPRLATAVKTISGCSFGVYLMHMPINKLLATYIEPVGWEWRLLVPFLIYAMALGITYLLKKVPGLRHMVP